ncbi:MAG: hypothetical protein MUC57_10950 [Desulfobacterales bacterium]|jgi:hypothetical protein|nr:hypothetical protein [Desulfobacterales bacterium]
MKTNILKILSAAAIILILGVGVSLADDGCRYPRGHAYGHYGHKVQHHYHHYAPPRPVYVERHYRPVVVERHYYQQPVRYVAPAPSGFFFGMSVADAGSAFSFGIGGR